MANRLKLNFTTDNNLGISNANISLKAYSKDSQGEIILGANCCGINEVEMLIDDLVSDLESIRREAKKKFR